MAHEQQQQQAPQPSAPSVFQLFKESMPGRVILPQDAEYDAARSSGWNKYAAEAKPLAIVQCRGTADVVAAVKFCRREKLPFTVSCGRHTTMSIRDGTVMIDLGPMHGVLVDVKQRLAHVQGGARNRDVDRECALHGMHTTAGDSGDTGFGGVASGAGHGYLARLHGLTIDNVVEVEVVTANGEVLLASESENSDLFWAVRGAAFNFGIVTRFTVRLHPVGDEDRKSPDFGKVLQTTTVYPLPRAGDLLRHVMTHCHKDENLHRGALAIVALAHGPDGQPVAALTPTWVGPSLAQGHVELAKLKVPGAVMDMAQPMSYLDLQRSLEPKHAAGFWGEVSALTDTLSDAAIDRLVKFFADAPRNIGEFVLLIKQWGGKIGDRAPGDTAYFPRKAKWWVAVLSRHAKEEGAAFYKWCRAGLAQALEGEIVGYYNNTLSDGEHPAEAFFQGNMPRLRQLKAKYDPDNVFCYNKNITPLPSGERHAA